MLCLPLFVIFEFLVAQVKCTLHVTTRTIFGLYTKYPCALLSTFCNICIRNKTRNATNYVYNLFGIQSRHNDPPSSEKRHFQLVCFLGIFFYLSVCLCVCVCVVFNIVCIHYNVVKEGQLKFALHTHVLSHP